MGCPASCRMNTATAEAVMIFRWIGFGFGWDWIGCHHSLCCGSRRARHHHRHSRRCGIRLDGFWMPGTTPDIPTIINTIAQLLLCPWIPGRTPGIKFHKISERSFRCVGGDAWHDARHTNHQNSHSAALLCRSHNNFCVVVSTAAMPLLLYARPGR